jgi:hypothetical protein
VVLDSLTIWSRTAASSGPRSIESSIARIALTQTLDHETRLQAALNNART